MKYMVSHVYLQDGYNPRVMDTHFFDSYEQAQEAVKSMAKDEKETMLYEDHVNAFITVDDNDTYLAPIGNEYNYYDWWHIYETSEYDRWHFVKRSASK